MAGIGFAMSADDDLTGMDLDMCWDPFTGQFSPPKFWNRRARR
jgi:primase-polymerase (primpol)-like protein